MPLAEELGPHGADRELGPAHRLRAGPAGSTPAFPPARIAVNVSCASSSAATSPRSSRECLEETGIDASLLELELSERGVLRSDPDILRQLHAIRDLGVRLAIDDFGTGNSAVVYLKQFPIDVLKIYESFVQGRAQLLRRRRDHQRDDRHGLPAGPARGGGRRRGAGQMDFLLRYGCDEYQGFLFSPAVLADEFAELLRRGIGHRSRHERS